MHGSVGATKASEMDMRAEQFPSFCMASVSACSGQEFVVDATVRAGCKYLGLASFLKH